MKRLTEYTIPETGFTVVPEEKYKRILMDEKPSVEKVYNRLKKIEDILGDEYDMDELEEMVQAKREGRCVVLPVPLHSVLSDMSDPCRPDVLKDFRISATWTHNGMVFYCPWNIFNQNIEKGYIRLMSESAEALLKGEQDG